MNLVVFFENNCNVRQTDRPSGFEISLDEILKLHKNIKDEKYPLEDSYKLDEDMIIEIYNELINLFDVTGEYSSWDLLIRDISLKAQFGNITNWGEENWKTNNNKKNTCYLSYGESEIIIELDNGVFTI
jgi:hypothetical protein